MRFTVDTDEFKRVMDLVGTVSDCAEGSRVAAHSVCLMRANIKDNTLFLDFCLNGSFLTYSFTDDVEIAGVSEEEAAKGEVRRSVDLGVLSGLKFSGDQVTIDISTQDKNNTITFSSGRLKGKLLVSSTKVEDEVEEARPKEDSVELKQTFKIADWTKALGAHLYGEHHNATDADRRPVRVYYKDEKLHFASQDKISAAYIVIPTVAPIKGEFDCYLLPKALKSILGSLNQEVDTQFYFGFSKDYWRIHHGATSIWFPNVVQSNPVELTKLVAEITTRPSFVLAMKSSAFSEAIKELGPFMNNSALVSKEDLPVISLKVDEDKAASLAINTSKAKDVSVELEGAEIREDRITLGEDEDVAINYKYLAEFVASLVSCGHKHLEEEEDTEESVKARAKAKAKAKKRGEDYVEPERETTSPVYIRWWPHGDQRMPTKGKTICVGMDDNMFLVSRVRRSGGQEV